MHGLNRGRNRKMEALEMNIYDCIVIGGGAAGLSAALTLGRARRNIAVFDDATNRNRVTEESHGFLTRDGIKPSEFRSLGIKELHAYPSVTIFNDSIIEVKPKNKHQLYEVFSNQKQYLTESILLATGIQENFSLPQVKEYYGKSLFSCPYCDGWELRDLPLAVIAETEGYVQHLSKLVFNWSKDLIIFTNGKELSEDVKNDLKRNHIKAYATKIKRLHGSDGMLKNIELEDGTLVARKGGFVVPNFYRPNQLAQQLQCALDENGAIVTDGMGHTSVQGVYVAGETEKGSPSSLLIAAADGARTAASINFDLSSKRF